MDEPSRPGQLELADPLPVDVLTRDPQVVGVLHREPALRGAPDRLGKAQRHLRRDATGAVEDAAERGRGDIELLRQLTPTDAVGRKLDVGDEFPGMGRFVHGHQR